MYLRKTILATGVAISALATASFAHAEPTAEVLHWWTSGGEAKAVAALKEDFEAKGGKWVDSPVAGGGGDAAMTVLRSRVLSGDAPAAVQLKVRRSRIGPNRARLLISMTLPKQKAGTRLSRLRFRTS